MMRPPARALADVVALFSGPALDASYGEDLPIRDHMLQCAALARAEQADDALVAAALLHDIGWALGDPHESTGAAWLDPLFPSAVTGPIALHVAAKRYLVATMPGYDGRLSETSRITLARQGGRLDEAGCRAFEADGHFDAALRLRGWDDRGKTTDIERPALTGYLPLLAGLCTR